MPKTRVLLADDHVVVARGLAELLKDAFDLIGIVHDGRALLETAERLRPDVVVTDISMPLLNGLDAIRQLRASHPAIKVVVLTMHADTATAVSAFRAGARGYVLKVSPQEEFVAAIEQAAKGLAYVTPLVAKDLIDVLIEAARPEGGEEERLTTRQREVLQLIAEGHSTKEVARLLKVSVKTVETHRRQLMNKLELFSVAELTRYAIREGLVSLETRAGSPT